MFAAKTILAILVAVSPAETKDVPFTFGFCSWTQEFWLGSKQCSANGKSFANIPFNSVLINGCYQVDQDKNKDKYHKLTKCTATT